MQDLSQLRSHAATISPEQAKQVAREPAAVDVCPRTVPSDEVLTHEDD
jgi:hypothetical protein